MPSTMSSSFLFFFFSQYLVQPAICTEPISHPILIFLSTASYKGVAAVLTNLASLFYERLLTNQKFLYSVDVEQFHFVLMQRKYWKNTIKYFFFFFRVKLHDTFFSCHIWLKRLGLGLRPLFRKCVGYGLNWATNQTKHEIQILRCRSVYNIAILFVAERPLSTRLRIPGHIFDTYLASPGSTNSYSSSRSSFPSLQHKTN